MLQHGNGWEAPGAPPSHDGVTDTRTYYGMLKGFRLSGLAVKRGTTEHMKLHEFAYNARGQLSLVYDAVHPTGGRTNAAAYVYDAFGRLDLHWNPSSGFRS